ncbi:MAG: hypothetical protein M1817_006782 [Caeruleum heppii]|nr:MAG: hypothetical protein M1817_006782 [Caeruleum heppii]
MAPGALLQEDATRDAAFVKLMHGKSVEQRNAFMSMLNKDGEAHRVITDDYLKHWATADGKTDDNVEEARKGRKTQYMSLVNNYYDLVTDLYEEGWAQSFHFCRFAVGETLLQALARHEHYMAHMINLREGMTVLDVGCGVGRPAREIATFADCNVVGLNNNSYQIDRATAYATKEGLADKVSFVKGDFMHMDFPENSFDAVYAMEATVHAPSLQGVYEQIYRVLKPGGTFGVFEWVMTDKYDDTDPSHRIIRLGIERGNGIANMMPRQHAVDAIQAAGFKLTHAEDLASRPDRVPWYYPLAGELRHIRSAWDLLSVLRLTWVGRNAMSTFLRLLETVRMAPSGTAETANELSLGADNLVAGGRAGLFTPMYFMIAKKPAA